jgi:hypothetical protein
VEGDTGLFREEALRRFRQGGPQGQVLLRAPTWTAAAFVALVVAAAVAALSLFLIAVPVAIHGPAVVTGEGRVVALLPAAKRADVERGPLVWKQAGQEPVPLRLERIEPRALSRAETGSLAAGAFARRPRPDSCLVVWAVPAPGLPPVTGEGSVSLPSQERRLVDLFRREAR